MDEDGTEADAETASTTVVAPTIREVAQDQPPLPVYREPYASDYDDEYHSDGEPTLTRRQEKYIRRVQEAEDEYDALCWKLQAEATEKGIPFVRPEKPAILVFDPPAHIINSRHPKPNPNNASRNTARRLKKREQERREQALRDENRRQKEEIERLKDSQKSVTSLPASLAGRVKFPTERPSGSGSGPYAPPQPPQPREVVPEGPPGTHKEGQETAGSFAPTYFRLPPDLGQPSSKGTTQEHQSAPAFQEAGDKLQVQVRFEGTNFHQNDRVCVVERQNSPSKDEPRRGRKGSRSRSVPSNPASPTPSPTRGVSRERLRRPWERSDRSRTPLRRRTRTPPRRRSRTPPRYRSRTPPRRRSRTPPRRTAFSPRRKISPDARPKVRSRTPPTREREGPQPIIVDVVERPDTKGKSAAVQGQVTEETGTSTSPKKKRHNFGSGKRKALKGALGGDLGKTFAHLASQNNKIFLGHQAIQQHLVDSLQKLLGNTEGSSPEEDKERKE